MRKVLLLLIMSALPAFWMDLSAQNGLPYIVENGDTLYYDVLEPAIKIETKTRKELRQYKKLVANFAKVYPYSELARKLVIEADRAFAEQNMNHRQKEKYVAELQKRIIVSYEQTARHMTVSQGQLMMKLIDRETGKSPHNLIRDYKSGLAAGFWQGLASVFGVDMKRHYDKNGADRDVEKLAVSWENGTFPDLYYSLFGQYPVIPEVPDNIKQFL
ncbi:MAG: DUF4294 domain-containing protein [Bacteroidales bacterium]|nr:DUF4294 domain-containing protein [Bacteroidales bacterium]